MGLSTYVIILFGISAMFYVADYQPVGLIMLNQQTLNLSPASIINMFLNMFNNPIFLSALVIAPVAALAGGAGSFSVIFIIPIIILTIVAQLFILPSSYILDPTMPDVLKILVSTFFNIFMALTIVSFVRGGE
jgi:hypothetical protein